MNSHYTSRLPLAWLLFSLSISKLSADTLPIRPLDANPSYLEWRGKPLILVTSGEHYGAVVNPDFNYDAYLQEIASRGFNHTRLFLGDYVEEQADFGIADNPLDVPFGKFLAPWARSHENGYTRGGNKFNLDQWDPAYFARLHAYLDACEKKGITVETVLFFAGAILKNHPLAAHNNINDTTPIKAKQYLTLENGNVLGRQEAYCRKMIRELNRHSNVIVNICNEPWFDHQERPGFASQPAQEVKVWIRRVSDWIKDEESRLPFRHLISVDLTNQGYSIEERDLTGVYANVGMFNVHYDGNGDILKTNRSVRRAFALNETGFNGTDDAPYRIQGWQFLFEGGAMYGNLDFSFALGHEKGTAKPEFLNGTYDCGGSASLRGQLSILNSFFNSLPLSTLRPDNSVVIGGPPTFRALAAPNKAYAIWFPGEGDFDVKLSIPSGTWRFEWVNIITGEITAFTKTHASWALALHGTRHGGGVALRITNTQAGNEVGRLGDQADSSRIGEKKP